MVPLLDRFGVTAGVKITAATISAALSVFST